MCPAAVRNGSRSRSFSGRSVRSTRSASCQPRCSTAPSASKLSKRNTLTPSSDSSVRANSTSNVLDAPRALARSSRSELLCCTWSNAPPCTMPGDLTKARLVCNSTPANGRTVRRVERESPKRDQRGPANGVYGSSPLNTPCSSAMPRVAVPAPSVTIACTRSMICA